MTDNPSALEALHSTEATPIAQLSPDIENAEGRVIDGVVTITWPYSVVTKSIAFILAEHDFRLRRDKGQIRIEFHGAAGRSLADSGIGGGDKIRISLAGAKWESHQARTRLPGSTQDWQLKFTNRLLLNVRRVETEGPDVIDIDVPEEAEPSALSEDGPIREATPPPLESQPPEDQATPVARVVAASLPAKRLASATFEPEEYASPAFLKRARVSYGSLFEGGFDMFDDSKAHKSKHKRRSRFSMGNAVWRYSSRSPSPEANQSSDNESPSGDEPTSNTAVQVTLDTPTVSTPQAVMKDEGCQTQDLTYSPSLHVQVSAESRLNGPAVPPPSTPTFFGPRHEGNHTSLQSPRRTLFGHNIGPHEAPRSAEESIMAYGANVLSTVGFGFGLDAREPHDDIDMYSRHPAAGPVISTAARSDGIAVSHFPMATFGEHGFSATASNIDPGLQFPAEMSAQDHGSYAGAPSGEMAWHAEAGPADFPSASLPSSNHHPAAIVVDSSPPREQSPDAKPQGASIDGSSRHSHRSVSRENEVLRQASPLEAGQQPSGQGDSEKEYEDGGDIPGEDYDLRNYDHAKADDQSESDDESPTPDSSDVEQHAIDLSEESAESEEEDEEESEIEEEQQVQARADEADDESAESVEDDVDADEGALHVEPTEEYGAQDDYDDEGEEYDEEEEEEYDEEEYDEEEYGEDEEGYDDDGAPGSGFPHKRSAPEEPVFISLLSDSEDEGEPAATQTTTSIPSAQPQPRDASQPSNVEPEPEPEPEPESVADSKERAEVLSGEAPANVEVEAGDAQQASEQARAEGAKPLSPGDRAPTPQPALAVTSDVTEVAVGGEDKDATEANHPRVEKSRSEEIEAGPQATTGVVEPGPSDLMDLDEAPHSVHQAPSAMDSEMGQHGDVTMESAEDVSADAAPGRHPVAGEVLDNEPPEAEITRAEQDKSTVAPDVMIRNDSDVQPVKSHGEQSIPDTVPSGITTVGEDHAVASLPDGQQTAFEAITDTATVKPGVDNEKVDYMQLSTTNETQPGADGPVPTQHEMQPSQDDEDALAAEAQIMTEYEEYKSPAKRDVSGRPGAGAVQPPSEAPDEAQAVVDESTKDGGEDSHMLITAKSLRSHALRKVGSSDAMNESYEDPSIRLAKAAAPETDHEEQPRSPTVLYATRKKVSQLDPGILLARAPEPEPEPEHEKQPKSPGIPRTTRSKEGQSDSSTAVEAHPGDAAARSGDRQSPNSVRVTRSMTDQAEPGAQPAKTSPTSTKSARRHATTPEPTRELRSKSHDQARPKTPETVPESVLKSPSVAGSVPEDEDNAALKRQLQRTLRSSLPDFLPLRNIRHSLNKTVDILAVSTSTPPQPYRPKHGPRDYMLEVILTDPSAAPSGVIVAHMFRPHQASLPVIHAGDVVLLRRMQVVSVKGRGFGVRVGEASAWAVFEKGDEEMLPQIKGPPVEVTDEEVEYAQGLRRWWAMQDEKALAKVDKATQKASQGVKDDSK